jgi:hypothetical protein
MGHVLLHLQTPVVWAGFTHSFLRAAQTYRAQSLAATGSGSSYRLTQYGTYTQRRERLLWHLFSPGVMIPV